MNDTTTPTGCYVICNFGPDERTNSAPVYLLSPSNGTAHHYTANLCRADMFATEILARSQMAEENEVLKAENHPLAGHLFVAEVLTRPILPPKED